MQRIGRVLHIGPNRNIVLKAESLPQIGDLVVDESRKPVGQIFDIFGPFSSPYVVVKPNSRETRYIVDQILYVSSSSKRRKRREKY